MERPKKGKTFESTLQGGRVKSKGTWDQKWEGGGGYNEGGRKHQGGKIKKTRRLEGHHALKSG